MYFKIQFSIKTCNNLTVLTIQWLNLYVVQVSPMCMFDLINGDIHLSKIEFQIYETKEGNNIHNINMYVHTVYLYIYYFDFDQTPPGTCLVFIYPKISEICQVCLCIGRCIHM